MLTSRRQRLNNHCDNCRDNYSSYFNNNTKGSKMVTVGVFLLGGIVGMYFKDKIVLVLGTLVTKFKF